MNTQDETVTSNDVQHKPKVEDVMDESKGEDDKNDDDHDHEHDHNHDDGNDDPPSFEDVLKCLGFPQRHQLTQILFVELSQFVCGFMFLSIVFVGFTPYHECRKVNETALYQEYFPDLIGNITSARVTYEACEIKIIPISNQNDSTLEQKSSETIRSLSCLNGRDYFTAKDTTYASEWDLACESEGLVEFSQTLFTIGQIIGGLGSSPLSDKFGRKLVFVISTCLCCVVEIAHICTTSIYDVYIIKFFSGLFCQGAITSGYIYLLEWMEPNYRPFISVVTNYGWVVTTLTVGLVAYFVQELNWRYYHGMSIASCIFAFLSIFVLNESPRWLVVNGRKREALEILRKACKLNGKDFEILKQKFEAFIVHNKLSENPSNKYTSKVVTANNEPDLSNHQDFFRADKVHDVDDSNLSGSSRFSLLCHKRLLVLLAVGWYMWLTNVLTYYGLIMTSSSIAGNRFLNFILMAIVELPSLTLVLYMTNKMGRRTVYGIFMGFTGFCFMISTIMSTVGEDLPGSETVVAILFILGKFSISAAFAVLYVITPELFPTNVRSTAHGYCSALGRLGSMIAPFLRIFYNNMKWGPAVLFMAMCFLAVLLGFCFPETKGKDLPNTLDDMRAQSKKTGGRIVKRESQIKEIIL